jgi:hypothetical protein
MMLKKTVEVYFENYTTWAIFQVIESSSRWYADPPLFFESYRKTCAAIDVFYSIKNGQNTYILIPSPNLKPHCV